MSPVGADASAEELAEKRESLALAAWHELLEGHEITVPVLVIDHDPHPTILRDIEEIQAALEICAGDLPF